MGQRWLASSSLTSIVALPGQGLGGGEGERGAVGVFAELVDV